MSNLWILAEAPGSPTAPPPVTGEPVKPGSSPTAITKSDSNAPGHGQQPAPGGGYMQFGLLAVMVVLLYFIMFRGPRKQQQKQRSMIESLKKNDRVQTIGGILGTVLDVKDDEVTIKIDESNNTKIKVIPGAISKVISDDKS